MDLNNVKELAIQGKDVFTLYVNNGLAWKKNHGFKVVAKQANSTIQLTSVGTPDAITLVKSTDGGITFSSYNVGDVITLANVGDSVILEAGVNGNSALGTSESSYHKFVMSGQVEIGSDSMNFLLNQSGVLSTTPAYAFTGLFYDCRSIVGDVDLSWFTTTNATNAFLNAFRGCTSLTSVDLSSLSSVGDNVLYYAFYGCTSLTTVDLSKVTSVGQYGLNNAFRGCTSLTTVYLSKLSSAESNGLGSAFSGCTHLELVDFSQATAVPALSNTSTFNNTNSTFQIVVPDSLYSTWIAASNWSAISSQIVKASDYTPAS